MIITIWGAVFPELEVPAEVAYVQAIDWLLDRFVTAVNVSGDTIVCRIVAHLMQDEGFDEMSEEERTSTLTKGGGRKSGAVSKADAALGIVGQTANSST